MNTRSLFSYYLKYTLKNDILTILFYILLIAIAHYVFHYSGAQSHTSIFILCGLLVASLPKALLTFPLTRKQLIKLIVVIKLISSILLTVSFMTFDALTGILRLIPSKDVTMILFSGLLYTVLFHVIGLLALYAQKIAFSFTKILLITLWFLLGLGIVFFMISPFPEPVSRFIPFTTIMFIGLALFAVYSGISYSYFYYGMTHFDCKDI